MGKSKSLIVMIGLLALCTTVFALISIVTVFSNGLSSENLNFTANKNITRYLQIPINSNVITATMNLQGITDASVTCNYQYFVEFDATGNIHFICQQAADKNIYYYKYTLADGVLSRTKINLTGVTALGITFDNYDVPYLTYKNDTTNYAYYITGTGWNTTEQLTERALKNYGYIQTKLAFDNNNNWGFAYVWDGGLWDYAMFTKKGNLSDAAAFTDQWQSNPGQIDLLWQNSYFNLIWPQTAFPQQVMWANGTTTFPGDWAIVSSMDVSSSHSIRTDKFSDNRTYVLVMRAHTSLNSFYSWYWLNTTPTQVKHFTATTLTCANDLFGKDSMADISIEGDLVYLIYKHCSGYPYSIGFSLLNLTDPSSNRNQSIYQTFNFSIGRIDYNRQNQQNYVVLMDTAYQVYLYNGSDTINMTLGANDFPSNLYIDTGEFDAVYDWNYSGILNSTSMAYLNISILNSTKSTCSCSGCSFYSNGNFNNYYCNVPLLFHSDTNGYLSVTAINLTYDYNDNVVPIYSGLSVNNSNPVLNASLKFSVSLEDDINLSTYIFSWNSTGIWSNDSAQPIGLRVYNVTTTKILANTSNKGSISWLFYFNDNAGNMNSTDINLLTITKLAPIATVSLKKPVISSDDLNATITFFDSEGDIWQANETIWYNNSIEVPALRNLTMVSNIYTMDTEIWTVSARVFDGYTWSSWINDSVTISDSTPPTINRLYVSSNTVTTSDSVVFYANVTDALSSLYWYSCIFTLFKSDYNGGEGVGQPYNETTTTKMGDNIYFSLSMAALGTGTLQWQRAYCTDSSSNMQINSTVGINITITLPETGPPGGGGGATRTTVIVTNATSELLAITCGNSQCDKNENPGNCFQDCPINIDTLISGQTFGEFWFAQFLIIFIIGIIGYNWWKSAGRLKR